MKKLIYILTILILTSCGNKTKEGGIPAINTLGRDEMIDESNVEIKDVKPKSPILKEPPFNPKELDYEIIKPGFFVKERFADLETQDKYGVRMMEFYDEENTVFYVSRILTEALQDPKVTLENNFDDKMAFATDLFLLSPYYSKGKIEPYIYYNYWFNEETFKVVPRYNIEEYTKTYVSEDEQRLIDNQIKVLVDYANENYDNNYDKAYYFAQWLAENNSYHYDGSDEDLIENNMYGALVKGHSQCSGFAQAFAILCQKVGIPCYSVTGNTEEKVKPEGYSGEHQWNVIKLSDNWSYVDVTGMVANGRSYYFYYFDRSKEEFVDYYVSGFFNDIEEYIR